MDAMIGSIEVGKLADLLVLERDPRDDLRSSEAVELVMINGRLFDARTLEQIEPTRRVLPAGPELETLFAPGPGCTCHLGPGRS